MESDIIQSDAFYRSWAWFEKNKKQVVIGVVSAIIIGLIVYFIVWQREEKQASAGRALSAVFADQSRSGATAPNPEAYLKVANEFQGSQAAGRATLLAATGFFTQQKYDQALTEFQKFARENSGSPFVSYAFLGIASTYEAQGKTDQALDAYNTLVERYPTSPVLAQAKFSLARLREAKGDLERALILYEDVSRDQFGALGNEAGMHAEEIKQQHPDLAAKVQAKIASPVPSLSASTNAPKTEPKK